MRTIKLLPVLAFSFLLSNASANSFSMHPISFGDPGTKSSTGNTDEKQNYDECNCTCEACSNCGQGNTEGEKWNNENYRAMTGRDFAEFKKFISARTFESTKLDMTKSVIDNNLFTTDQVREILSWFTFESNKLDIAKYAFQNTVDRNSYYKLYDAFVFESNVVDLDNFVKNFR